MQIEKIRQSLNGKQAREPIASSLEEVYENMTNREGTNEEVIEARGEYSTLNKRLNAIETNIGDLSQLRTKNKTSIVGAINELAKKVYFTVESKWKTLASSLRNS